jgi:16S rRNA (cytidine1402-2'-O)-methyltransferase
VFEGFITTVKNDRRERMMELATEKRTLILYEAPHKLKATLNDLLKYWGDRRISLCREITKLNEEILRTTIAKAVEFYEETDPRGEYVLVVEGAKDVPAEKDGYPEDPGEHVQALMESGMDRMDAIKSAAKERGMSKGAFYKLLLGASGEE